MLLLLSTLAFAQDVSVRASSTYGLFRDGVDLAEQPGLLGRRDEEPRRLYTVLAGLSRQQLGAAFAGPVGASNVLLRVGGRAQGTTDDESALRTDDVDAAAVIARKGTFGSAAVGLLYGTSHTAHSWGGGLTDSGAPEIDGPPGDVPLWTERRHDLELVVGFARGPASKTHFSIDLGIGGHLASHSVRGAEGQFPQVDGFFPGTGFTNNQIAVVPRFTGEWWTPVGRRLTWRLRTDVRGHYGEALHTTSTVLRNDGGTAVETQFDGRRIQGSMETLSALHFRLDDMEVRGGIAYSASPVFNESYEVASGLEDRVRSSSLTHWVVLPIALEAPLTETLTLRLGGSQLLSGSRAVYAPAEQDAEHTSWMAYGSSAAVSVRWKPTDRLELDVRSSGSRYSNQSYFFNSVIPESPFFAYSYPTAFSASAVFVW